MTCKTMLLSSLLCLSTFSAAQTKVSGTMRCQQSDEQQARVGDTSDHVLSVSQTACTWSQPLTIEGVADTDGVSTGMNDSQGSTLISRGYFVDNMANGDKVFLHYEATVDLDGDGVSIHGKWSYVGGTGKFKGIQGEGTLSGSPHRGGTATYDLDGEYTLPKS